MSHDHSDHDMTRWMEPAAWEERYAGAGQHWSGRPNPVLVTEAASLTPGTAVDLGCGEGADVVWLARQGWRVTGVDFSVAGLARAAAHASDAGVADRVAWEQADARRWLPGTAYDLVTAHFLHLTPTDLAAVLPRLATAVAPGGTLLYVGHDPTDLDTAIGRHGRHDLMPTAASLAARLDARDWTVEVAEARPRTATTPDGTEVTVHDAVLRARRRVANSPADW